MPRWLSRLFLFAALAGCIPFSSAAGTIEQPDFSVSATLGYHFSTGDYGGSDRTNISFVPLTLAARYEAIALRLTVPYINVSGVDGFVQSGESVITGNGSGLGDVTLDGIYTLDPLIGGMPFLDLSSSIKFPTADEDRGLGTGEFDYQLGLGAARTFDRVTPFASVGYRFVGDPATYDLHDVWLASGGVGVRLRESLDSGAMLFYQASASAEADDQLDIMPYLNWRFAEHWTAGSYVTAGLMDGSPDFGIGLQLTYSTDP